MREKNNSLITLVEIKDYSCSKNDLFITDLSNLFLASKNIASIPHRVNYYQIIMIEKGEGSYCIDGHEYNFDSKSLFAISKGQIEYFKHFKNVSGHAVLFSEDYINKNPDDIEWINKLKLFDLTSDYSPVKLTAKEFGELLFSFNKINFEVNRGPAFARNEILHYMIKLFLLSSERIMRSKADEKQIESVNSGYLSEFKSKLEENYSTSRSVSYYADQLCITEKKLNQITLCYWGRSAKRIIEERVLLEIKRLLIYTDYTTKEIGNLLGFSDPANLNKFFKKHFQMTPVDFRCSYRN